MKIFKLIVIVLICSVSFMQCNQEPRDRGSVPIDNNLPQIALLGTFHFASTTDLASVSVDSIFSKRRQREIGELVDHLAQYKPTKILLEYPASKSKNLNERYSQYIKGEAEPNEDEINQLGFKLAKKLNHSRVYAIDHYADLPFEELTKFVEEQGRMEEWTSFVDSLQEAAYTETGFIKDHQLISTLALCGSGHHGT